MFPERNLKTAFYSDVHSATFIPAQSKENTQCPQQSLRICHIVTVSMVSFITTRSIHSNQSFSCQSQRPANTFTRAHCTDRGSETGRGKNSWVYSKCFNTLTHERSLKLGAKEPICNLCKRLCDNDATLRPLAHSSHLQKGHDSLRPSG